MSSIDPELLPLLACPASRQPLKEADAALLAKINAAIEASGLLNVGGEKVTETIEGGLVREDGTVIYPIRGGIPVLLVDEGIPVSGA